MVNGDEAIGKVELELKSENDDVIAIERQLLKLIKGVDKCESANLGSAFIPEDIERLGNALEAIGDKLENAHLDLPTEHPDITTARDTV